MDAILEKTSACIAHLFSDINTLHMNLELSRLIHCDLSPNLRGEIWFIILEEAKENLFDQKCIQIADINEKNEFEIANMAESSALELSQPPHLTLEVNIITNIH